MKTEHSVGVKWRDNIKAGREYMGWVTWGAGSGELAGSLEVRKRPSSSLKCGELSDFARNF